VFYLRNSITPHLSHFADVTDQNMKNTMKTIKQFFVQRLGFAGGAILLSLALCGPVKAAQCGRASWYALDGHRTASGELMNSARLTAAHRTLPFGSKVRIRNRRNGRSVVVRINDRGPFSRRRIVDVSRAAARKLGFLGRGTTTVCLSR
jgi:rare lipoprotein A